MNNDEEASAVDIPTFADLVDAIESGGTTTGSRSKAAREDAPADSTSARSAETPDDSGSEWQWETPTDGASTAEVEPPFAGDSVISESKGQAMVELLGDASNVLVLGPAGTPAEHDVCSTLTGGEAVDRAKRVLITTDASPDDRLRLLRGYSRRDFSETAIIAVGDQARSSGADSTTFGGSGLTIETLADPTDLAGLGLRINNHLSEDVPTFLCFHSLTGLLRTVETQKVFRFLHVLNGRIRSTNARAHYHLDPASHTEETVFTVKPIFDFSISFEADGSISIDA